MEGSREDKRPRNSLSTCQGSTINTTGEDEDGLGNRPTTSRQASRNMETTTVVLNIVGRRPTGQSFGLSQGAGKVSLLGIVRWGREGHKSYMKVTSGGEGRREQLTSQRKSETYLEVRSLLSDA